MPSLCSIVHPMVLLLTSVHDDSVAAAIVCMILCTPIRTIYFKRLGEHCRLCAEPVLDASHPEGCPKSTHPAFAKEEGIDCKL